MSILSLKTWKKFFADKDYRFLILAGHQMLGWLEDRSYINRLFKAKMGYYPNLKNPTTFSEKLQWQKLYDRNPLYTLLVDKVKVKEYIAEKIGEQYVIPMIGVWRTPDEIDFSTLPTQFVLKCNHNSGRGMCICKDKSLINVRKVKRNLWKGLRENKYLVTREWPYKNVPRRILAEKYMQDEETGELRDYKFFCFDGIVRALFIASGRQSRDEETTFDFYDSEFNHLDLINGHSNSNKIIVKPKRFEEMKHLASLLSKGIPQVRVDFYEINNRVFFGEMTFFHWSGWVPFVPEKWDYIFGSWVKLPKVS